MNNLSITSAMLLATSMVVTGCVQRTPLLESQMGRSVTMLKAQQIINPEAGHNPDPVAGMDGKAAKSAYDHYQKTFKAPEPQGNAFTIGIGSGQ
jgi:hypothetical protein